MAYGSIAKTSAQQAQNRTNLQQALSALGAKSVVQNGNVVVTQKAGNSGGSYMAPSPSSIGGGGSSSYVAPRSGTGGNPAGSQAPIAMAPLSGTVGNPAGSKLPVGMSSMNNKAATTASAIDVTKPKKENDWQSTLANVQASNVRSQQVGGQIAPSVSGYGMTKDPNYKPPSPPQTVSAFDAYQAASNSRVAKDLQTAGLSTSSGGGVPTSFNNLMSTPSSYNPNTPLPTTNISNLIKNSTPLGGSSVNNIGNQANALGAFNSSSSTNTPPVSTPSTPAPTVPQATSAPVMAPTPQKSSYALDNTKKPAVDQTALQTAAEQADQLRNQADAAAQAAKVATTDDDRKYYSDLYDKAQKAADDASVSYQSLLQQSEEEKQAQAQLDAETNALQLGKTDVAGQPIPLAFITGQQSALERRSLDRTAPLTSKLARLQAARTASLAGARDIKSTAENRLGNAESNLESYSSEQRKRQQELQDQATKQANERTTLSPGQQQFDSKGNLIASVAPKPTTATKTTTPSGAKPNAYKTSQQIPESLRNDVLDDIVINQGNLPDIISAYPEISSSVIQAMYNQFSTQGTGLNKSKSREI